MASREDAVQSDAQWEIQKRCPMKGINEGVPYGLMNFHFVGNIWEHYLRPNHNHKVWFQYFHNSARRKQKEVPADVLRFFGPSCSRSGWRSEITNFWGFTPCTFLCRIIWGVCTESGFQFSQGENYAWLFHFRQKHSAAAFYACSSDSTTQILWWFGYGVPMTSTFWGLMYRPEWYYECFCQKNTNCKTDTQLRPFASGSEQPIGHKDERPDQSKKCLNHNKPKIAQHITTNLNIKNPSTSKHVKTSWWLFRSLRMAEVKRALGEEFDVSRWIKSFWYNCQTWSFLGWIQLIPSNFLGFWMFLGWRNWLSNDINTQKPKLWLRWWSVASGVWVPSRLGAKDLFTS